MKITGSFDAAANTITVEAFGETRTFPVGISSVERGWVMAHRVFASKFRTGAKLWPTSVTFWLEAGRLCIEQAGHSNRNGAVSLVGWWNPESKNNSRGK